MLREHEDGGESVRVVPAAGREEAGAAQRRGAGHPAVDDQVRLLPGAAAAPPQLHRLQQRGVHQRRQRRQRPWPHPPRLRARATADRDLLQGPQDTGVRVPVAGEPLPGLDGERGRMEADSHRGARRHPGHGGDAVSASTPHTTAAGGARHLLHALAGHHRQPELVSRRRGRLPHAAPVGRPQPPRGAQLRLRRLGRRPVGARRPPHRRLQQHQPVCAARQEGEEGIQAAAAAAAAAPQQGADLAALLLPAHHQRRGGRPRPLHLPQVARHPALPRQGRLLSRGLCLPLTTPQPPSRRPGHLNKCGSPPGLLLFTCVFVTTETPLSSMCVVHLKSFQHAYQVSLPLIYVCSHFSIT